MIFPEISLKKWLEKYPDLDQLEINCDHCGKLMLASKPFIERGYVGILAPDCSCGKNRHTCMSKLTTSKETFNRWSSLINDFIG